MRSPSPNLATALMVAIVAIAALNWGCHYEGQRTRDASSSSLGAAPEGTGGAAGCATGEICIPPRPPSIMEMPPPAASEVCVPPKGQPGSAGAVPPDPDCTTKECGDK